MKSLALTYAVAGMGVAVFQLLNLPLPWLLGPIFACLFAALAGVPLKGNKLVNDAMRSILGVAVGATFTVALLGSMVAMWPTLLMIPLMIASIGFVGVPYFQKIWGFDFATSYYSAMPGGLQDMLAFGEEAGGDVRALSLIHATRVMVIVVALPFILQGVWDADLSNPPGAPATSIAPSQLLLMVLCGLVGWRGAKAVGMFGASILGPLIIAAILSLLGILQHRPPAEAIWMAQFYIGMTVGTKYVGVTMPEVRRDVAAALGLCVILLVLTVIFAEVIYLMDLAPPMETLLAFAPGGQAEMTVLALIVGADMAFVIAHHVLRIFVVILGAPLAARLFSSKSTD
ncbi:AbrB family transcriptional regulator [Loktanella sp. TSTF-M6]|uniref:AbrB family transcriptional regulator n=1 Tax=Loktanella gaetbuli TaxID=2881335 RepID=A0ABS8BUR6_9RHOB|nr:AbrB family transcriptional regulator [Loktanella gaetbuli]MCB5199466.1 AbrB family transcriptional regulator [Loktanella gaetbuli]